MTTAKLMTEITEVNSKRYATYIKQAEWFSAFSDRVIDNIKPALTKKELRYVEILLACCFLELTRPLQSC